MNEQQAPKKPHVVVKIEVFDYHHFSGQDPQKPRPSTRIKGVMTMPDGLRTSVEFFIDGHHHFNASTPFWDFGLRVGADYKNRLSISVVAFQPSKAA